jgi:predicted amidohydrolase YtcJ
MSLLRALVLLLAAAALPAHGATADRIWKGGTILTMDDAAMRAEAVAVKDGRIVAVGTEKSVMAHRGKATEVIDLGGRALLPGFVDSHGHVFMGGMQALSANLLAPPDGVVTDVASLQQVVRDWMAANQEIVERIDLVIGFGYDNAQLAELRHPTRDDLDAISTTVPIMLVHQSGHIGVGNTKALEVAGITASSENPPGGVIRRRAGGEPDGVLEETAFFGVLLKLIPRVGEAGARAMVRAGADLWARFGYTTAQEGRTQPGAAEILRAVADEGGLAIDVVAYSDVLADRGYMVQNVRREYQNRYRLGGAKLTIDGSPQGFTAWRDRPYYAPVGNYPPGYVGYAAVSNEQVLDAVNWAYESGIQLLVHSNGEASSDLLIAAHAAAQQKHGAKGRRDVLIHGQFLREDQVAAFDRLRIFPSLFPMHTFYWGDWHRDHTVGPVNAENISPTGWVLARGMKFGSHHDAPVAFPDSMRILDATVTRRTRSGDILGPAHRVDVLTALKAMTIWPAWQHFEEDSKGSIEAGKLADFVVLSADPTAVDPETLDQLKVLETIKEGRTVFALDTGATALQPGSDANPALARLLVALGGHGALPAFAPVPASRAGVDAPAPVAATCMSDGILALTAAMLGDGPASRRQ